jgi:hypothetical protein
MLPRYMARLASEAMFMVIAPRRRGWLVRCGGEHKKGGDKTSEGREGGREGVWRSASMEEREYGAGCGRHAGSGRQGAVGGRWVEGGKMNKKEQPAEGWEEV